MLRQLDIPAHRYHGKMTAAERDHEQEMYMKSGRRTVMVATSAFGLGIDKPDIRYIIHYQAPASLEQYVQEAGRAGRDGRRPTASCSTIPPTATSTSSCSARAASVPTSSTRSARRSRRGAARTARRRSRRSRCRPASVRASPQALLAILEEAELVRLSRRHDRGARARETIEEESRSLAGQFATLRTQDGRRLDSVAEYVHTTGCRAVMLRRYFGESNERPCGLCDACRGVAKRPSSFYEPVVRPPRRRRRKERLTSVASARPDARPPARGATAAGRPRPTPDAAPPPAPGRLPAPMLPPPLPPPLDF